MPDAAAFALALRAVLPPGVNLGQADPSRLHPLAQGERLPGAVPARLAEFSAGRAAARIALHNPDQPIPIGPDRAPIWPAGLVGSITHCAGLCLAVVGKSQDYQGLGLDAEPDLPLAADLWPTILRGDEHLSDHASALVHFVAKEAAYKAQYSISERLFGFQTLRLTFDEDRFEAEFAEPIPPFAKGDRLRGKVLRAGGYLGAFVAITPKLRGGEFFRQLPQPKAADPPHRHPELQTGADASEVPRSR